LGCAQLSFSLNETFLKNLWHNSIDPIPRMMRVFRWYPNLINEFLATLTTDQQQRFFSFFDRNIWEPEQQKYKELLLSLCEIHLNTSHYFKRFFTIIVSKHPNYIQYLKDTFSLRQIAKGMLGTIDSITDYVEQKKQLNSYHDLEFLRVGLEALQGAPFDKINEQFTEFSDNYLQILFDICKQEVDRQLGGPTHTRDLIAIYATGGHAREQAFDDDWDLIVLLNEKDESLREYCNRIIAMMNSEIISRGTMPHYRFADHFGYYVTLVDDLDELFSRNDPEVFIDKSQVLSARMIVGSTKFQKDFEEKIIRPHIFENCRFYAEQMVKELKSRHNDAAKYNNKNIDIKEGIGGLRDIEFLLLIFKAKYNLREPLNWKLINNICETASEHRESLTKLKEHGDFLKQLRDLYRLAVSADDVLQTDQLDTVARIMNYENDPEKTRVEKLIAEYHKRSADVNQIVSQFLENMKEC
jgi:glutamine synthetase adenylyltransferase